jgi:hypothetical protein
LRRKTKPYYGEHSHNIINNLMKMEVIPHLGVAVHELKLRTPVNKEGIIPPFRVTVFFCQVPG